MIAARTLLRNGALALGLMVFETAIATVVGGFVGYYAGPRPAPTVEVAPPPKAAFTVRWANGRLLVEQVDPDARFGLPPGVWLLRHNGYHWEAVK